MKLLCEVMGIQRSSFYNWKQSLANPSERTKTLLTCTALLSEYHAKYPSHDHRWLSAKIRLDTGLEMTDAYALKCCRNAGIRSRVKHYRYRRPGETDKVYPNLLLSEMKIDGPGQCIVSCSAQVMLAETGGVLTLYVDFWNYELTGWVFRTASGSFCGPDSLPFPEVHPEFSVLLQTGDSALYGAAESRDLMPMYSIPLTVSHTQRSTDAAAMEAISGWLRQELLADLQAEEQPGGTPEQLLEQYRTFFNERRPLYSLGFLTPRQYREKYLPKEV